MGKHDSSSDSNPPGFLPDASGGPGARFGRDPVSGRAYRADGTVRKARTTLSAAERLAALAEAAAAQHATIGREAAKAVPALATLAAQADTLRARLREAAGYATPEARARRVAYYEAMLAAVDAKGKAAAAFIARYGTALEAVTDLYEEVGADCAARGAVNPAAIAAAIAAIPVDARRAIAEGAAPAADPFAPFRRAEPDA